LISSCGTKRYSENKYTNGNDIICDSIKCFASTAEILRPKERIKVEDLSTVTIGYIKDKHPDRLDENQRLRALFDSGCSAAMINKKFVKIRWSTKAGSFKTKKSCDIEFTLPGFHEHRKIACKAYVDESHHESCNYDMIIGRDIMHSLGINLLFDTAEISWDNAKIHMQHPEMLRDNWVDALEQEIFYAHDPDTTDAERIQGIFESKYTPADLCKIVEKCTHLEKTERILLLHLLQKYEDLFDRSLGTWKTDPIQLELKDPNVKPYHAKPYPVPHSQEMRLKDEIRQLCKYGVLRKINDSEWACPMFTISKPDGSLRSLADLREVNKVIKRKPFPLPKITNMLQKLEGFYVCYIIGFKYGILPYTIYVAIMPFSSRLCTIVLPWGKHEHCRLPSMGVSISPDVFQEKMSELMSGLEFAWAYLDDLLILSTEKGFEKHLD
jgi:hypothetical protein